MMEQHSTLQTRKVTPALRDGLIAMAGLTVAMGSFFSGEITLWWLGA